MRPFTSGIAAVIAFGALSATAAADPAVAPSSQAAPASATSTTAPKAAAPAPGTVRRVVCLSVSLQCFGVSSAPSSGATQMKALDLRAPDIRTLYSEAELRRPVDDPYEDLQRLQDEQVKVEGARPDPNLPIGILALPWAVMNPTQAWRIFAPVPSAK